MPGITERERIENEINEFRRSQSYGIDPFHITTIPSTEFPPPTLENSPLTMRTFGLLDFNIQSHKEKFTEFYKNSQAKNISIGSTVNLLGKNTANCYEGWSRTLNLLRNFAKIKKQDAVERAKTGWAHPTDNIEYLFRYFGLGYDSTHNQARPILFKYPANWPFYQHPIHIGPQTKWYLSELPNNKLIRISERLTEIINHPKCYKELKEQSSTLLNVALEMKTQFNAKRDFTPQAIRYQNPHIYISINF
jgi:hypothetical protein